MQERELLVIGDSISLGYTPPLSQALAGLARVYHIEGNSEDSRNIVSCMHRWVGEKRFDLIVFNSGLHDIKRRRPDGAYQVTLPEYEKNLRTIVDFLRTHARNVVWISTTPVLDVWHNQVRCFDRYNEDVERYNSRARAVMEGAGVAICDLYSWVISRRLSDCVMPDGVHMKPAIYAAMGEFLAGFLGPFLWNI